MSLERKTFAVSVPDVKGIADALLGGCRILTKLYGAAPDAWRKRDAPLLHNEMSRHEDLIRMEVQMGDKFASQP